MTADLHLDYYLGMEIIDFVKGVLSEEGLADKWTYVRPLRGELAGPVVLQDGKRYLEASFGMLRAEVDDAQHDPTRRAALKQRILHAIANAKRPA